MSEILIEVESGKPKRLLTKDTKLKKNIVVKAKGEDLQPIIDKANAMTKQNAETISEAVDDLIENSINGLTDFRGFYQQDRRMNLYGKVDFSNGTEFADLLRNNTKATEFVGHDISGGKAFGYSFSGTKLTKVVFPRNCYPESLTYTFYNSSVLETIEGLNFDKVNSTTSTFAGCKALTGLYLYNIKKTLIIGSGTSYGHLLSLESLVHIYNELCPVTSATLTQGSANNAKIEGLYCKIVDDTNEKLPMELCESTNEGAMPIDEYAALKGWFIQ